MRYASLHRTIEGGLETDRVWAELIEACVELGRHDEAENSFWNLKDHATRRRLLVSLQRRGLLLGVALGPAESDAEDGGPSVRNGRFREGSLPDRIADGFRFLFSDHMPITAIVTTVTFPIVVGLGGFLTSTVQNSLVLPLLALIPALSVVGLVGALGRRILVEASLGLDDPPEIPTAKTLARESGRFLLDFGLLAALFLGPGFVLANLASHVGWSSALAALAVGLLLLPMAMALRQTRDDWTCLAPSVLFGSIVRGGAEYLAVVGVAGVLFLPSFLAVLMSSGSHLYLLVSVVGPLAVVPTFVVSRLLGQFLFAMRRTYHVEAIAAAVATAPAPVRPDFATPRLSGRLQAPTHPEAAPAAKSAPAARAPARRPAAAARPAATQPGTGSRPAARPPAGAPRPTAARPTAARPAPAAQRAPAARPAGAAQPTNGTPAPAARRPLAQRTPPVEPRPAPASVAQQAGMPAPRLRIRDDMTPAPATPAAPTAPARRGVGAIIGEAIPDLTKMPGVSVLKGDARVAAGAAAPTRDR